MTGRLCMRNLAERLTGQFSSSPQGQDQNDFEINPEISFTETYHRDIESVSCHLNSPFHNFNILSLNVECINTKYDSLLAMIDLCQKSNIELSVIILQETWQSHIDSELENHGYKVFQLPKINFIPKSHELENSS